MVVGENGVLNRAQEASKKTQFASEKEAIEFIMSDIKTGLMIGEEIPKSKYLGKALSKRTLGNTTEWGVVTVDGKNYDNGWYLLEKGNEIEGYGVAKQSWLINYNTGKTIGLEEGKYSKVSAEDVENQVAKENLIFNLDSNLIDMAKNEDGEVTKASFENLLDENSELVNFNWDGTTSGVTKTSFMFDGVDDYIKVNYNDSGKKEILKNNGLTFEFYGKFKGINPNGGKEYLLQNGLRWFGLFGFGLIANNGAKKQNSVELLISDNYKNNGAFIWRAGIGDYVSPGNDNEYPYNQEVLLNKELSEDIFVSEKPFYFTMSLDTTKINKEIDGVECYKYSIFINNEKLGDFNYNKDSWKYYCENDLPIASEFWLGRVLDFTEMFTYMECYALRLYNRGLSDTEIKQSYSDSVAAHSKLVADSKN